MCFRVRPACEVGEHTMSMKVLTNRVQPCVCVVYLLICPSRVFKKKPVPNPSKYFCTLQSLYEGNLKVGPFCTNSNGFLLRRSD